MILLSHEQTSTLKNWFLPDKPGPLVGLHVIHTQNGSCHVDKWPNPQAGVLQTSGNYTLVGDPNALNSTDLSKQIVGFVEAPDKFLPLLKKTFSGLKRWERVIFKWAGGKSSYYPSSAVIRRLTESDAGYMWGLSSDINWISKTWGGPAALAYSGFAWGAFFENQLASVACSFFVGEKYEDIGVVTENRYRGRGLSTACVRALCQDVSLRGRTPSWSTSPDNLASIRVAEKSGFAWERNNRLWVTGIHIPS